MNLLIYAVVFSLSLLTIALPNMTPKMMIMEDNLNEMDYAEYKLTSLKKDPVTIDQTTPSNLVKISYQGLLEGHGIPCCGKFIKDLTRGDITAQTLVKIAIENGRLSPQTLENTSYLDAVQQELDTLNTN